MNQASDLFPETGIHFYPATKDNFISFTELRTCSLKLLNTLHDAGVGKGDNVILQCENNREFLIAFWACINGGIIAIPLTCSKTRSSLDKLAMVWKQIGGGWILIDNGTRRADIVDLLQVDNYRVISQSLHLGMAQPEVSNLEDLAYIQFSSGSTSEPKGVTLTHGNLLSNIAAIVDRSKLSHADRALSWMPLTHDMGLICFHLSCLAKGIGQVIMDTAWFVKRPAMWMTLTNEHRISLLYSPNFGYQYLTLSCDESIRGQWDLSSVRLIYNGAEPINKGVCENFLDFLAPCGLNRNSMFMGYGMAEACVAVCLPELGSTPEFVTVERSSIHIGAKIIFSTDGLTMAVVGKPVNNCKIRICDNEGNELPIGFGGNIQINGENVTRGYYCNEPATFNAMTTDGWLRTGDTGFITNSGLVVMGRSKEIIIINGFNYYPSDIESSCIASGNVVYGNVAACAVNISNDGDQLAIFIASRESDETFEKVKEAIRNIILNEFGFAPSMIIKTRKIPCTTSGKIQRFQLVADLIKGEFGDYKNPITHRKTIDVESLKDQVKTVFNDLGIRYDDELTISYTLSSLSITMACSRLSAISRKKVSPYLLMSQHTIGSLAQAIFEAPLIAEAVHVKDHTRYRANPVQEKLWLLAKSSNKLEMLNIGVTLQLESNLDVSLMEKSFELAVQQFGSLRTLVSTETGDIFLEMLNDCPVDFSVVKERNLDDVLTEASSFEFTDGVVPHKVIVLINEKESFLLVRLSHIISDGWSMGILLDFISKTYDQLVIGTFKANPIARGTAISSSHRENSVEDAVNAFWRKEAEASFGKYSFPGQSGSVASHKGHCEHIPLSENQLKQWHDLQKTSGASDIVLYMSLLYLFIAKTTGQRQGIIGTEFSGREDTSVSNDIGCYIKTLFINIDPLGETSLGGVVDWVKNKYLQVIRNGEHPLELIFPTNSADLRPSFNTLVISHDFARIGLEKKQGVIKWKFMRPEQQSAMVDLQLEGFRTHSGLTIGLTFDTGIFSRDAAKTFAKYFQSFMDQVLKAPNLSVGDLTLIGDEERKSLITLGSGVIRPTEDNIVDNLVLASCNFGERIAIIDGFEKITYHQLNDRTDRIAENLCSRLNSNETVVGVLMPRSVHLVVAMISVWKAGRTYLPIDSENPPGRIQQIIDNSGCTLLLTSIATEFTTTPAIHINTIKVDAGTPAIRKYQNPEVAALIYTSGSTGIPKGVRITTKGLATYCRLFANNFNVNKDDRVVFQSSVAFDTSFEEIVPILISGGTLVISSDGGRSPEDLGELIQEHEITILSTTPLVIRQLDAAQLKSLRLLISGGSKLEPRYIQHLFGHVEIWNTYGPTEATICASYHHVTDLTTASYIGRPVDNARIYILDDQLSLQPTGFSGEIFIAGPGVAQGYHNVDPKINESFLPDILDPALKMYRTGDIGRWVEDSLEFLGRKDDQHKFRGFRIEFGEIETVSSLMPGINAVCVQVYQDSNKEDLVLFYVCDQTIGEAKLRKWLADRLPYFLIPTTFIIVSDLPLNQNRKIDLVALRNIYDHEINKKVTTPNPSSKVTVVHRAWSDVLQYSPVNDDDDFFMKGGHSISALKLIAGISTGSGVQLTMRDVFANPTPSGLSYVIDKRKRVNAQYEITHRELKYYPLSRMQEKLYSDAKLTGNSYNLRWTCRIKGNVSPETIQDSLVVLLKRHQILRTVFVYNEGQLFQQVIDKDYELPFVVDNLHLKADFYQCYQKQLNDIDSPFDLARDLPLRVRMMNIAPGDWIFSFSIHHLVADAWSMDVFVKELSTVYRAIKDQNVIQLDDLQFQYGDYALWSQQHDSGSTGHPMLSGRDIGSRLAKILRKSFDEKFNSRLSTFIGRKKTTYFSVLATTASIVLGRFAGRKNIVIGAAHADRPNHLFENQIGCYFRPIEFTVSVDNTRSLNDILDSVQMTIEDVLEDSSLAASSGSDDVVVVVVVQDLRQMEKEMTALDLSVTILPEKSRLALCDLRLIANLFTSGVVLELEFRESRYSKQVAKEILRGLELVIEQLISTPEKMIGSVQFNEDDKTALNVGNAVDYKPHFEFS
ncbi:MAG: amino acid adenylation domain-containing protein [Bacteroidota bacterium]